MKLQTHLLLSCEATCSIPYSLLGWDAVGTVLQGVPLVVFCLLACSVTHKYAWTKKDNIFCPRKHDTETSLKQLTIQLSLVSHDCSRSWLELTDVDTDIGVLVYCCFSLHLSCVFVVADGGSTCY